MFSTFPQVFLNVYVDFYGFVIYLVMKQPHLLPKRRSRRYPRAGPIHESEHALAHAFQRRQVVSCRVPYCCLPGTLWLILLRPLVGLLLLLSWRPHTRSLPRFHPEKLSTRLLLFAAGLYWLPLRGASCHPLWFLLNKDCIIPHHELYRFSQLFYHCYNFTTYGTCTCTINCCSQL